MINCKPRTHLSCDPSAHNSLPTLHQVCVSRWSLNGWFCPHGSLLDFLDCWLDKVLLCVSVFVLSRTKKCKKICTWLKLTVQVLPRQALWTFNSPSVLACLPSFRSVVHEEHPQPHLPAESHHHVCDAAAPDLLHGSHEHHPGVAGG